MTVLDGGLRCCGPCLTRGLHAVRQIHEVGSEEEPNIGVEKVAPDGREVSLLEYAIIV